MHAIGNRQFGMDGFLGRTATTTTSLTDRFSLGTPGTPTRDPIKCGAAGESDFEPRIRKFVSYVTPQALAPTWKTYVLVVLLPKSNLN
jgi:hypothetical protein